MTPTSTTVRSARRQFTLAELLVVLLILAATAGMAVVLVGGRGVEAQEDVALVSMRRIQAAIYGSPGAPGYFSHVGEAPARLADLLRQPSGVDPYDPVRKLGWGGPYLQATGTYPLTAAQGFTLGASGYGLNGGEPALLDPYGNPFVLDPVGAPTRILSAGPDGDLNTTADNHAEDLP